MVAYYENESAVDRRIEGSQNRRRGLQNSGRPGTAHGPFQLDTKGPARLAVHDLTPAPITTQPARPTHNAPPVQARPRSIRAGALMGNKNPDHKTKRSASMIPNDSIDFYPTPDDLADGHDPRPTGQQRRQRAFIPARAHPGAFRRETAPLPGPSSGPPVSTASTEPGRSPADTVKQRPSTLIASSFPPTSRAVLKKDGFRVVHDDFLTFRPCKQYAAIAMNPPFSAGPAHLLKALDIMKDGGKIACILNAETIRNPYTNERKELLQKLDALTQKSPTNKTLSRMRPRRSGVEIALVVVNIPPREPVSKIRLELQHETERRFREDENLAALVSSDPSPPPSSATTQPRRASAASMRSTTGSSPCSPLPQKATRKAPCLALTKAIMQRIHDLRAMYWKKLFDMPQIRDNLTYEMLPRIPVTDSRPCQLRFQRL